MGKKEQVPARAIFVCRVFVPAHQLDSRMRVSPSPYELCDANPLQSVIPYNRAKSAPIELESGPQPPGSVP